MKKLIKILLIFIISTITLFGFAIPLNILSSNWYNQYLPNLNNRPLSDITFVDSLLGFAVTGDNTTGDTNYILKTTNGGDNWFKVDSVYGDISRVIFINTNTGYICGGWRTGIAGGFVSKTTNSGINWNVLSSSIFANHFDDIFILNKDTIYLVDDNGFDGGVFRSTNEGNNWEMIFNGSISNPHPVKIYMYDRNMGFFSTSYQVEMYRTTNGGFNWIKINGEDGFSQITFIDSLTGWKASGYLMKKTTNGGLNWVNQPLPNPTIGHISGGMYHFSLINKDTIWGVGGSYQYPNLRSKALIYRTTNSGLNWYFQIPDTTIFNFYIFGFIQFINKNVGWAYTFNGIHTTNGGDTTFVSVHQIGNEVSKGYKLFQNYPNPFNAKTKIKYKITERSFVEIYVYDIRGREISKLEEKLLNSGEYECGFNAENISSGIYFYTLKINGVNLFTKKMILIK